MRLQLPLVLVATALSAMRLLLPLVATALSALIVAHCASAQCLSDADLARIADAGKGALQGEHYTVTTKVDMCLSVCLRACLPVSTLPCGMSVYALFAGCGRALPTDPAGT